MAIGIVSSPIQVVIFHTSVNGFQRAHPPFFCWTSISSPSLNHQLCKRFPEAIWIHHNYPQKVQRSKTDWPILESSPRPSGFFWLFWHLLEGITWCPSWRQTWCQPSERSGGFFFVSRVAGKFSWVILAIHGQTGWLDFPDFSTYQNLGVFAWFFDVFWFLCRHFEAFNCSKDFEG